MEVSSSMRQWDLGVRRELVLEGRESVNTDFKEAPFSVLCYKLFSRSHLELCPVKLELVRDKAELSVRGALGPSYLCPSQGAIGLRVFKELEAWCALCRMAWLTGVLQAPEIMTADLQPDGKKTCCLFCVLQENFRKVEGLLPYTIHPGRRLDQDSILL